MCREKRQQANQGLGFPINAKHFHSLKNYFSSILEVEKHSWTGVQMFFK
jgi:hypothetical protein